jgi:hypothetical protein
MTVWNVIEIKTGKKLCECSDERDAILIVSLDPDNKTYTKNKYILDQIIDVESKSQKQLPTNEIVVNMNGGVGGSWREIASIYDEETKRLKENKQKPLKF